MNLELGVLITLFIKHGSGDIGSFVANVASILHLIATSGPSYALGYGFFGAVGTNNTNVCGFFTRRNVVFVDEKTTIGTCGHV